MFWIIIIYFFLGVISPFPIWQSYFKLWLCTLFDWSIKLPLRTRLGHILFLLRYAFLCPIYSFFWYIDDIFYRGYLEDEPPKVIVVMSQPRSGTTFLHRTLAADNNTFFAIRHLEWRFPFICVQKFLHWTGLYQYLEKQLYWPDTKNGTLANKMHNACLGDWEEDGMFFEERFLHHFFIFRRFPYPSLVKEMHKFETLSISLQKKLLKQHQKTIRKIFYLHGKQGQIVLLKENESMQIMSRLSENFPDVKYIFIGRQSKNFLNSYFALSRQSTISKTGIDPKNIHGWYDANIWKRLEESSLLLDFLKNDLQPANQTHVTYEYFVENVPETITKLYEKLELELHFSYKNYLDTVQTRQNSRSRGYQYTLSEENKNDFVFYDAFVSDIKKKQ